MLDTLDLKEQLARGDEYQRNLQQRTWRMWAFVFAALLLGLLLPWWLSQNFSSFGLVVEFLPLAALFSFYYYGRQTRKEAHNRAALIRKRLPDLLPEMQEFVPLHRPNSKKGFNTDTIFLGIIAFFFMAILLYFLMTSNALGIRLCFIAGVMLLVLAKPLLRILEPNLDAENRAYLLRLMGWTAFFVLIVFTPVFSLQQWLSESLIQSFNLSFSQGFVLLFVPSFLLYWLFVYAYALVPHFYISLPAARGDYETALRRGANLNRLFPKQINLMFAYGGVLLDAGRWHEAETLWRDFIQENQNNGVIIASALVNLAAALEGQGRYAEMKPLLEAAIKIRPEASATYRELSFWYLLTGESSQRALELSEAMLHFAKRPRHNLLGQYRSWGANLLCHAFALASNSQKAESLHYLERASAETDPKHIIAQGSHSLVAAHVHRALGDTTKAKSYYEEALRSHPNNAIHQSAAKALQELDAAQA